MGDAQTKTGVILVKTIRTHWSI